MITDLAREGIWPTMTYVVDKNTEIDADDDKDRNVVKEVVPPRTYFTRRVLEKVLTEWWNRDPGVCFCKVPGMHLEPITVSEGYVKRQRSVFETLRRLCYLQDRPDQDVFESPQVCGCYPQQGKTFNHDKEAHASKQIKGIPDGTQLIHKCNP